MIVVTTPSDIAIGDVPIIGVGLPVFDEEAIRFLLVDLPLPCPPVSRLRGSDFYAQQAPPVGSQNTIQVSVKKRTDGGQFCCPVDGTTFNRKQNSRRQPPAVPYNGLLPEHPTCKRI